MNNNQVSSARKIFEKIDQLAHPDQSPELIKFMIEQVEEILANNSQTVLAFDPTNTKSYADMEKAWVRKQEEVYLTAFYRRCDILKSEALSSEEQIEKTAKDARFCVEQINNLLCSPGDQNSEESRTLRQSRHVAYHRLVDKLFMDLSNPLYHLTQKEITAVSTRICNCLLQADLNLLAEQPTPYESSLKLQLLEAVEAAHRQSGRLLLAEIEKNFYRFSPAERKTKIHACADHFFAGKFDINEIGSAEEPDSPKTMWEKLHELKLRPGRRLPDCLLAAAKSTLSPALPPGSSWMKILKDKPDLTRLPLVLPTADQIREEFRSSTGEAISPQEEYMHLKVAQRKYVLLTIDRGRHDFNDHETGGIIEEITLHLRFGGKSLAALDGGWPTTDVEVERHLEFAICQGRRNSAREGIEHLRWNSRLLPGDLLSIGMKTHEHIANMALDPEQRSEAEREDVAVLLTDLRGAVEIRKSAGRFPRPRPPQIGFG